MSVSSGQIWSIVIFVGLVGAMIFFLMNKNRKGTEMEAATDAAVQYWKRTYREDLSREDSLKLKGCFVQGVFYAFKLKRKSGPKASRFCIIIVEKTPTGFNIVKASDSPGVEEMDDPFKLLDGFIFRSPVPLAEPLLKSLANPYPTRNPQVSVNVGQPKGEDEFKKMGGGG